MANFSFVSNAQYRPRSFQEILQPLQMYTDEYNQVQEGLGELSTQAGVFENLANQQADPETYAMYKKYANDLEAQATELAANGLNPVSRKGLINMKARYAKEIVPIDKAFQYREKLVEEQRKGKMGNDSLMFSRTASNISLDELIKNPSLSPQSLSGKDLKDMSAQAASAFAKTVMDNPRYWDSILGEQYFETMVRKGASQQEILAAIDGLANANPQLKAIRDQTMMASGIYDWKDLRDKDGVLTEYGRDLIKKAENYANMGLWQAMGDTQYQTLQNQGWVDPNKKTGEPTLNKFAIHPVNLYSQRERTTEEKFITTADKYFSKDANGNLLLNEAGIKEFEKAKRADFINRGKNRVSGVVAPPGALLTGLMSGDFGDFYNKIGLDENSDVGDFVNKYRELKLQNENAAYDSSKHTEFRYPIDSSESKSIKQHLVGALGNVPLEAVDYNNKEKKFGRNSDVGELDLKDFLKDNYTILDVRLSDVGNTMRVLNSETGETMRFRFPKGLDAAAEQSSEAEFKRAKLIQEDMANKAKSGYYNSSPQAALEYQVSKNEYDMGLQNGHWYFAQTLGQNKTKDQEIKQLGY